MCQTKVRLKDGQEVLIAGMTPSGLRTALKAFNNTDSEEVFTDQALAVSDENGILQDAMIGLGQIETVL